MQDIVIDLDQDEEEELCTDPGRDISVENRKEQWVKASGSFGTHWNHFKRSKLKLGKTNRYTAKCNYCGFETEGRPHVMKDHIMRNCSKIPRDERRTFIEQQVKGQPQSNDLNDSGGSSSVVQSQAPSTSGFFQPFSKDTTNKLHKLLLKAFVSGGIPFNFAENAYFKQYQTALARTVYRVPNRKTLSDEILPILSAEVDLKLEDCVTDLCGGTVSLDGWTDISGISYYAVLLLTADGNVKHYIGNIELTTQKHTAENILSGLKELLLKKGIFAQKHLLGIVSDSPKVMIKLRKLFIADFPKCISLDCVLHALNLVTKDIIKSKSVELTVKRNLILVNYFRKSTYWNEYMDQWALQHNIRTSLHTYSETRWFSMIKVCVSVDVYEDGFKSCLDHENDAPVIPKAVRDVLLDWDHFVNNKALIAIINPVAEHIIQTENHQASPADALLSFVKLYVDITQIVKKDMLPPRFNEILQIALKSIDSRAKRFCEPIYLVALFLDPGYKAFVTSKKIQYSEMKRMVVELAKQWGYDKNTALKIKEQLDFYYNQQVITSKNVSPREYWKTTNTKELKVFASQVLNLVPHSAAIEQMFSLMAHLKKKWQARMSSSTLTALAKIKLHLCKELGVKQNKYQTDKSIENQDDTFTDLEENDVDSETVLTVNDDINDDIEFPNVLNEMFDLAQMPDFTRPQPSVELAVPTTDNVDVNLLNWDVDDIIS